ncbi:MAG: SGNH/GDSL hydrolase family protein, partial [Aestuariivirgaceae bacterium]
MSATPRVFSFASAVTAIAALGWLQVAHAEPVEMRGELKSNVVAKSNLPAFSYIGEAQETYQIFVFGDSLAAGLFSGMSRMAEGDLRIAIDGRFKDDSGLARPEFYDWAAALPKIHERREIDIAVILIGSNDGQDIRSISGPIPFSTPEWASTYAQRVDSIIGLLKSQGVAIYWVELPPMGPAPLEAEAEYVATIQRDRAMREKLRYIETRKTFSDVNGKYTDQGTDPNGTV